MSNLKEERLMILEMVREGKLSTDDATKLLNSISNNAPAQSRDFDNDEFEEKLNKFYGSVDSFAKDLKERFGKVYSSAEPKVKEVTKKAMVKTASIMEDLSEKINESVNKMEETTASTREETSCCCDKKDEE